MSTKNEDSEIIVVDTRKTESLNGSATLTFNIGKDSLGNTYIRVVDSTSTGFWNSFWLSINKTVEHLKKLSNKTAITSIHLNPVINEVRKSGSENNSGYYFSCLKSLGLFKTLPNRKRQHWVVDPDEFLKIIDAIGKPGTKKTVRKKVAKKKAARSRKT